MLLCVVTAGVFVFDAVLGVVIASLTFHASCWFMLYLFYTASLVADTQSVCYDPFSCVGTSYCE